jgi:hypothetical protein
MGGCGSLLYLHNFILQPHVDFGVNDKWIRWLIDLHVYQEMINPEDGWSEENRSMPLHQRIIEEMMATYFHSSPIYLSHRKAMF